VCFGIGTVHADFHRERPQAGYPLGDCGSNQRAVGVYLQREPLLAGVTCDIEEVFAQKGFPARQREVQRTRRCKVVHHAIPLFRGQFPIGASGMVLITVLAPRVAPVRELKHHVEGDIPFHRDVRQTR
jgi:hypothetical protein